MNWSQFFPSVSEEYQGSQLAFYFLVLITIVGTGRSLIHMFAPDGGANSIAGLAIDIAGGSNLIGIFGQWGASQLMLAIFYWVAILRYRFLVPFMLATVFLEQLLRLGIGQLKPLEVADAPPGEVGSYILLPLSLIALVLSVRQSSKPV